MKTFSRISVIAALTLASFSQAFGEQIVYQSNKTVNGPEVNFIYFNRSDTAVTIIIDFGVKGLDPARLTNSNCVFLEPSKNLTPSRGMRPLALEWIYGAFEQESTIAKIPPGGFVHRYLPVGPMLTNACETTVVVTNLSIDQQPRPITLMLKKVIDSLPPSAANFTASSSIEETSVGLTLVTTLLKSGIKNYAKLRLVSKSLQRCDADIADAVIRQGMEGAMIELGPDDYAVVQTALQSHGRPLLNKCQLNLKFEDVSTHKLHALTVQVSEISQFEIPAEAALHR